MNVDEAIADFITNGDHSVPHDDVVRKHDWSSEPAGDRIEYALDMVWPDGFVLPPSETRDKCGERKQRCRWSRNKEAAFCLVNDAFTCYVKIIRWDVPKKEEGTAEDQKRFFSTRWNVTVTSNGDVPYWEAEGVADTLELAVCRAFLAFANDE